jgi:hypothetical protein
MWPTSDPTEILARLTLLSRPKRLSSSRNSSIHEPDQPLGASSADATRPPAASEVEVNAMVASVAGDGVVTATPVKYVNGVMTSPATEVVTLPEGMLERKSSIRSDRRRKKFIECLNEDVVHMGE